MRGQESEPAWSRPLLWLIALLAGALTLWGLSRNGYTGRADGNAGPFGFSSSTTRTRDSWIESHRKVVKVPGATSAGMTLYYLSTAA